jgi:Ser/Thr protein kinase RdoA (MazF antagonist)
VDQEDFKKKLKNYVSDHLLSVLERGHAPFNLEFTNKGQRNVVTFLEVDGEKPLVLKGVPKKAHLERAVEGSLHLERRGFRVPRAIYADDAQATYRALGCYILVEEKMAGQTCEDYPRRDETICLVAREFFQLHQFTRPTWGMISSERNGGYGHYLMRKVKKKLTALGHYTYNLTPGEKRRYWRWFKRHEDLLGEISLFSLSHGDPHMSNLLVSPDGDIVFLDNENVRYLPPYLDYYKLEVFFCGNDRNMGELLEKTYLSNLKEGERDQFRRYAQFFRSYVLLTYTESCLSRYVNEAVSDGSERDCSAQLNRFRAHMEERISP